MLGSRTGASGARPIYIYRFWSHLVWFSTNNSASPLRNTNDTLARNSAPMTPPITIPQPPPPLQRPAEAGTSLFADFLNLCLLKPDLDPHPDLPLIMTMTTTTTTTHQLAGVKIESASFWLICNNPVLNWLLRGRGGGVGEGRLKGIQLGGWAAPIISCYWGTMILSSQYYHLFPDTRWHGVCLLVSSSLGPLPPPLLRLPLPPPLPFPPSSQKHRNILHLGNPPRRLIPL